MSGLIDVVLSFNLVIGLTAALVIVLRSAFYHQLSAESRYWQWLTLPLAYLLFLLFPEHEGGQIFAVAGLGNALTHSASIAKQEQGFSFIFLVYGLIAAAYVLHALAALGLNYLCAREYSENEPNLLPQHRFKILTTQNNTGPAVFGLFKPKLFLPEYFLDSHSRQELNLIFKHEWIHWQRRDTWFNLLALIICSLCWFNPIVWVAYKMFRRDQELSCDALVCRSLNGDQKAFYARLLLKQTSGRNLALMANWAQPKLIKERIMNIKNVKTSLSNKLVTLVGCCFIALSVSAASQSNSLEDLKPVDVVPPKYPREAAEQNIEGYVRLAFNLDATGNPVGIKVIESKPEDIFDAEAKKALSQWRFNQSNRQDANYTIQFKL